MKAVNFDSLFCFLFWTITINIVNNPPLSSLPRGEISFEHGLQDNKYCFMKKCQLYSIKR